MTIIVFFIFAAVVLGAGAMLSPAYPTAQPRIGLSAALALALITGGAVFYGTAAGWNTLVVDYMLFVLVTGIFLGGTLSYGQKRAEARGEELADADQGWPGPFDLIGLLAALALFIVVAHFFGTLDPSLMFDAARINSGEISLYATGTPAYTSITAYLSGQLSAPMTDVQPAVNAVLAGIAVWLCYDLGAELSGKPRGRLLAFVVVPLLVILVAVGAGPALMGFIFLAALTVYGLRYIRDSAAIDLVTSGLMLGAVALSVPPLPLVALAIIAAVAVMLVIRKAPTRGIAFAALSVAVALVATLPTLATHGWPLIP